jgi:putative transposase
LIRDKLTVLNRMKCQRKVEYRLYPSPNQAAELARMSDTCRKVYNWALAERRDYYEATGKTLSFAEECRRLTVARRTDFAWKAVHTHALQLALKRVDLAFGHFFRRVKSGEKPGYPRFKSQDRFSGFGFKEHGNGWRLEKKEVRITGIGRVKLRGKASFDTINPKTCELIQRSGKWYMSVTFVLEALPERERTGEMISGLDWGVETFATLANSDGTSEEIANPRHLRKQLDRLAVEQQAFARRKRGSKRRHLAKQRVARLHEKVRRQRQNFLHQTTAKLAASRRVIAVEKLSPLVMSAAGGAAKAGLNREILAAAAGAFHSMLAYKAEEAGSTIIEIDPRLHRPSQTCSGGGPARKKSLAEREHVLPDGSVISRDLNAARNLLNLALGREPAQHSGPGIGPDTGCETATIAA